MPKTKREFGHMFKYGVKNICASDEFSSTDNFCMSCARSCRTWRSFFDHLSCKHAVNLFACPPCSVAYLSPTALENHLAECQQNSADSSDSGSPPSEQKPQLGDLDPLATLLVCAECGFYVTIAAQETFRQKSNYKAFWNHAPRRIFQIAVYCQTNFVKEFCFLSKPDCESLHLSLNYVVPFTKIPLTCKICDFNFKCADAHAIDAHMLSHKTMEPNSSESHSCTECAESSLSQFWLQVHRSKNHSFDNLELLEFLRAYEPQAPLNKGSRKHSAEGDLFCDLCTTEYPMQNFNSHDCAVHYMRRYQLNGQLIKCPCANFGAEMRLDWHDASIFDLTQNLRKSIKFNLNFDTKSQVIARSSVVSKSPEVWVCRFCNAFFDPYHSDAKELQDTCESQTAALLQLNLQHLKCVHKKWPLDEHRDRVTPSTLLSVFSVKVQVTPEGVTCPKKHCSYRRLCSVQALRVHLRLNHGDEPIQEAPEWPASSPSEIFHSVMQQYTTTTHSDAPNTGKNLTERKEEKGLEKRRQAEQIKRGPSNILYERRAITEKTTAAPPSNICQTPITRSVDTKRVARAQSATTLLLHPPPVPGMENGQYNFISPYRYAKNGTPAGLLLKRDDASVMYAIISLNHVTSMLNVGQSGRANFAIGCIPVNFKLPTNPNLAKFIQTSKMDNSPVVAQTSVKNTDSVQSACESVDCTTSPATPSLPSESYSYECPVCSVTSKSSALLQAHLEKVHLFLCSLCDCCFVTEEFKLQHEAEGCLDDAILGKDDVFFCMKCQRAFKATLEYYAHLLNSHQSSVDFDENSGQVFPCCSRIYKSVEKLIIRTGNGTVGCQSSTLKQTSNEKNSTVTSELQSKKKGVSREDEDLGFDANCAKRSKPSNDHSPIQQRRSKVAQNSATPDKPSSLPFSEPEVPFIPPVSEEVSRTAADVPEFLIQKNVDVESRPTDEQSICGIGNNEPANCMDKTQNHVTDSPSTGRVETNRTEPGVCPVLENLESCQHGLASTIVVPEGHSEVAQDVDVQIQEMAYNKKSDSSGQKSNKKDEPRVTIIDDDIQILSSDDEEDGATAASSSKILKDMHSCSVCSRLFKTARAVREHTHTHAFDAGATCAQTFGVPAGVEVHACRVCCLAYEQRDVFDAHVRRHGVVHSCTACTAVSFDKSQLQTHQKAHSEVKLVFGCVECRVAYRRESTLLLHCSSKHGMRLLWLCTSCGRANTDYSSMLTHTMSEHRKVASSVLMPCPLIKMHYQPADSNAHEKMVEALPNHLKQLCTPAECPHRTFLSYAETLICCPGCGSMIPATKYLLENEKLRNLGQFKLMLVEQSLETLETQKLHPAFGPPTIAPLSFTAAAASAKIIPVVISTSNAPTPVGQSMAVAHPPPPASHQSRGLGAPAVPSSTNPRPPLSASYPPVSQTMQSTVSRGLTTVRPVSHVPTLSITMTTASIRQTAPVTARPNITMPQSTFGQVQVHPPAQPSTMIAVRRSLPSHVRTAIAVQQSPVPGQGGTTLARALITAGAKPLATVAPSLTMQQQTQVALVSQQADITPAFNVCPTCNASFSTAAALKVHTMKHDMQNLIFCLECGYRTSCYNGFYDHMFNEHGQRLMGQVSSSCGNCGQRLTSLEAYAQHAHAGVRRCAVCCSMVSGDDELHAHKVRHAQFGDFFCIFCGACFASKRRLNRHLIKHACDTWVMCRECGMCYKQVDQLIDHFVYQHYSCAGVSSSYNCTPCGVNVNTVTQPNQHVVARHVVYAARLRAMLDVDQQTFRSSLTASARFLYDKVDYKEAFACALCLCTSLNTFSCRRHALTDHQPTRSPPTCPVWSFLTPAKALAPMFELPCRCAYCDQHHPTFKRLAQHLVAAHQPVHLCSSCDDAPYDDAYDAAYHAHFSHGAALLAVDVAPPHDSPLVSCRHGLTRSPSFSPLYCLLCGTCLADQSFVTHISSHRLTASVNGNATLDLCPVCGVCLINKSEEALRAHATSHGASGVLDEALIALSRADLRFFRCFCNGIVFQTPTPSSTSCLDSDQYLTANCTEPPHCSLCDKILSWNGPGIVDHFIQFHAPSPDATPTLLRFHKEHSARVAEGQLFCRMCNFLASWPCC